MDMDDLTPRITPTDLMSFKDQNLADEFHRRLIEWINDFHRSLDDKHEVGARLVNFGQSVTFHIEDIGYWNPSLISFQGKNENGEPVKLVQHVSQISILLVALKCSGSLIPDIEFKSTVTEFQPTMLSL